MIALTGVIDPNLIIAKKIITDFSWDCVQPNSVDLRVKDSYSIDGGVVLHKDGSRHLPQYKKQSTFLMPRFDTGEETEYYQFDPGILYQVEFYERVDLPLEVCALTILRSSMNKSGSSGEVGLFDSGYCGGTGITVSVSHQSFVEKGAPLAQMVFLTSGARSSYNGYYRPDTQWLVQSGVEGGPSRTKSTTGFDRS